jgi:hypothetical protein
MSQDVTYELTSLGDELVITVLHEKPWAAVVLAPLVEMTGMTAVMVLWPLWFPVWYSMLYDGFFRRRKDLLRVAVSYGSRMSKLAKQ